METMEVVAVLDMSGSMSSLTNDTIGGFNTYVKTLQEVDADVRLTMITFNTEDHIVHAHKPAKEVPVLTTNEYRPCGGTALLDALGKAIDDMKQHIMLLPDKKKPSKVSFFVSTDGEENSSRKYTREQVKSLVETAQKMYEWEFIFAGANIDAFSAGQALGFKAANIAQIPADERGQRAVFQASAEAQMCPKEKCASRATFQKAFGFAYNAKK